jgi:exodeoxyribonuclease-5
MRLPDEAARRQALTAIDRTMLVEAGAGSGKTAILAGRIVFMLASGIGPKHIAAITFTEFAASELLIRVGSFVRQVGDGNIPRELWDAFEDGLSAKQRRNLATAADSLDQLTCTTIHGFAQALIRPYPAEADIDPGADIIDPAEADLAFGEQFDTWLKQHLSGDDEDDVVAQLVLTDESSALSLVRALAQFLRSNRTAMPPTGTWAGGYFRRFAQAVTVFRRRLDAAGFHEETTDGYLENFAQILADLSQLGLESDKPTNAAMIGALATAQQGPCFTQQGKPRSFQLLQRWRDAARANGRSQADGENACVGAQRCYDGCHEACGALMTAAAGEGMRRLFVAHRGLISAWRAYKRSAALLDFDDLLYTARELLANSELVRRALADRFAYVLVDEFQDTDPLQLEILWRLCGEPPGSGSEDWMARELRPGALFLVGDPKQAIYRFRGADVSAYLAARHALGRAARCEITANFRSVEPILDFVNSRFARTLATIRGQPGFAALSSTVPGSNEPAVVALDVAVGDDQRRVDIRRAAEATMLARLCRRLIGNRLVRDPETGETRPCRAGDIALVAPAGTDLWRYEEALEEASIPVSTQAGKSLFRRQEIQDLIALTCALADARDTLALGALLRGPLVGLREVELLDIAEALPADPQRPNDMPQLHLWTAPEQITHQLARDVIERLQSIARRARSTAPHLLLCDAVEAFGMRPQLRQRYRTGADRAPANVDLFLEMARAYDVRGLRAFARDMRANWENAVRQVEGRPDAAQESVALITIHAAKGLEWPVVVPINMMGPPYEDNTIIYDRSSGRFSTAICGVTPAGHAGIADWVAQEQARERVRLWYVVATRARELLVLPRHSPDLAASSWGQTVDLALASLPAIDPAVLPERMIEPAEPARNSQTRELFAAEAQRIVDATRIIRWQRPSRDEGEARETPPEATVFVGTGTVEETEDWPISEVAGGAARGTILHKLMEEVLTGETPDDPNSLHARATELICQLGIEPAADARLGIAPAELAQTVLRTLALPEVLSVRPRLLPESAVYGYLAADQAETLVSGIADAIEVDEVGRLLTVIDWKSDVAPSTSKIEQYQTQVDLYRSHTGARQALLVFMTTGRVVAVGPRG